MTSVSINLIQVVVSHQALPYARLIESVLSGLSATLLVTSFLSARFCFNFETGGFAADPDSRQDVGNRGTWCGTNLTLYTGLVEIG